MQPPPMPPPPQMPPPPTLGEATAYALLACGNLMNAVAGLIRSGDAKTAINAAFGKIGQAAGQKAA